MKITKEKIIGLAGSTVFCGIAALILYFTFLFTQIEAHEEGVLVNFGTVDWASGTFEPRAEKNSPEIPAESKPNIRPEKTVAQPERNPPAITQETEPTVAIEATEREKERKRLEQERQEQQRQEQQRQAEEQRKREEEQKRINAINQQMQGAFGAGETSKGSEGTASDGSGNQGSTQGNAPVGSYVGVGGYGGFDLRGRTLGAGGLPRPSYSGQEEGKIVISIIVNPQGNVLSAEIGRGTNITNNVMRNSALDAARKAKFNTVERNENQSGTITYNYKLN
jgi:TonB family protein